MMRKIVRIFGSITVFLAACMGCAVEKDDLVVAQVGNKTISAKQLRAYSDKLPENLKGKKARLEEAHLQIMIDVELLLMEASSEGVDKSRDFLKKLDKAVQIRLVNAFQQREIEVGVTGDEVEEYIKEEGLSRAIRLGDIMVAGEDQAKAALEEIRGGKSFEQVARKWSINRDTAGRGGDIGSYSIKDQMIPLLQDKLFSLAVGEVSEPIKIGDRHTIFKVLDDTTIALGPQQKMKLYEKVKTRKFDLAKTALVEEFKRKYHLELDRQGMSAFVESRRRDATFAAEEERDIVLYRYDGGEIKAGALVDAASYLKGDVLAKLEDEDAVIAFTERNVVPNTMIMEAALRAQIDKEADIAEWIEDQKKQILMMEFRAKVLKSRVVLSQDEVRQFYEDHPEKYMNPEQIGVQEILVGTEVEALRLMEKIQKGVSLGELARKYSIRSREVRDEEGKFHFHPFERLQFGGFVEFATEAEIGELTGPVKVEEGFSIFKVLSRERKREPFAEAEWRVRSHAKREKNRKAFNQFMGELRKKYESAITVREDNLQAAFETE